MDEQIHVIRRLALGLDDAGCLDPGATTQERNLGPAHAPRLCSPLTCRMMVAFFSYFFRVMTFASIFKSSSAQSLSTGRYSRSVRGGMRPVYRGGSFNRSPEQKYALQEPHPLPEILLVQLLQRPFVGLFLNLVKRCVRSGGGSALTKELAHADADDLPRWAEPLARPRISSGLARWMFNSISHCPRLVSMELGNLPTREQNPVYWENFDGLIEKSKRATAAARVRHLHT